MSFDFYDSGELWVVFKDDSRREVKIQFRRLFVKLQ